MRFKFSTMFYLHLGYMPIFEITQSHSKQPINTKFELIEIF